MKISTAALLAWRTFGTRPRRTAVLLLGFGVGVAVMIALLAVGDALLVQAQDRSVVSGGDLVILPAGIDPEVLKVSAVTGMFLSLPNARFLVRQVVMGPRFGQSVEAASPEITGKLVYVRTRNGIFAARASAAIPSAAARSRSALAIDDPKWSDTQADRDWIAPSGARVLEEIDRFHKPVSGPEGRTWAEWWYFNFATPDGHFGYVSFIADRQRRVLVSVALTRPGGRTTRWQETHANGTLPLMGTTYRAGPHMIELRGGVYHVRLARPGYVADLQFRPVPHLYFPPVEWQAGAFRSGYVVPGLRTSVTGEVRLGADTIRVDGTGYHDHNWGVWQAVTWEWGTASTPEFALLAGLVRHRSLAAQEMLVTLHGQDGGRSGLLAILRGSAPVSSEWRDGPKIRGVPLRVPGRLQYAAANDAGDRLTVEITPTDIAATPVEKHVFLQMRGGYKVRGQIGGRSVAFTTQGFAETFLPLPSHP